MTVKPENLLLLVLLGGLLLLMFNRTRKQQRETQQIQADLVVGAQVMTTAGLFATVVELDDATMLLETSPGQRSRWDRRAVARIVAPEEPAAADGPAAARTDSGGSTGTDTGNTLGDTSGVDIEKSAGAPQQHDLEDGDDDGPSSPGSGTAPSHRG